MYTTCPKCNYKRQPIDNIDPDICPGCGIYFSKWMKHQFLSNKKEESKKNKKLNFLNVSMSAVLKSDKGLSLRPI